MEFSDHVRGLRRGWPLIVLFVVVGLAVSIAYSVIKTPLYEASSMVFVSTQSSGTVQELAQGNAFSTARVKTYAKLTTTPIVLDPVIDDLGLDMTAEDLANEVSASAQLETTLIDITVQNPDPEVAAELANEIAASLIATVGKLERAADNSAVSPIKLERVQSARVPTSPVSPNTPLNIVVGLVIGLALGITAATLRARLDHRVRTERDVVAITSRPIIGRIAFDPKASEHPLILDENLRGARAEAFRMLRTNLQFLKAGNRASFVVTSSIESEGKSSTSINLATVIADSGSRVVLVDADLRRPRVDQYMGLVGSVGLSDVLIGRVELEDALQPWGDGGLFVLAAGTLPPNPSELLGSQAMEALVNVLERDFDVVIFDAPPLLPVTDAAILAGSVAGVILVVAAGKTRRAQLSGAISVLENVGLKPSGLVLNLLPTKGPDGYGYGNYAYGADERSEKPRTARHGKPKESPPARQREDA